MMDYKKRAVTSFIGAALGVVGAIILFSVASQGEASRQYTYDDDFRTVVGILKLLGWLCVVFTVVDVIQGFAYSEAHEESEETAVDERSEVSQPSDEAATAGKVRCACCNYLISPNALRCLHCGTLNTRAGSNEGNAQVNGLVSVKTENGSKEVRKCLFCGEPMVDKQTFCGACGRRQD